MIICHCKAVSDRTIRQVVQDGACSLRQVARACNAGRDCGGCHSAVLDVIEEEAGETNRSALSMPRLAAAS